MTGAELVRNVAERVMGWMVFTSGRGSTVAVSSYDTMEEHEYILATTHPWESVEWNPLASISDAFQLVAALHAKGWRLVLEQYPNGRWAASLLKDGDFRLAVETEVCRAITIACARAAGVEVE